MVVSAVATQVPDSARAVLFTTCEGTKPRVQAGLELVDDPAIDGARVGANAFHVLVLVRLVRVLVFETPVISKKVFKVN